eukprot:gene10243-gene11040
MRLFYLYRNEQIVAQGVEFDDKQICMKWLGDVKSIVIHKNIKELKKISVQGNSNILFL